MNPRKPCACALLAACLTLASTLPAGGEDAPAGATVASPVHLSEAASEAALSNPTAREARLQWLVRASQERGAWGDFEPALAATVAEGSEDRQNTAAQRLSQLGRTEYVENTSEYSLGLEGRFFTGAGYSLGYTLSRTASDLTTGDEYESNLALSVDQPLLRGATHQAPLAVIKAARLDALVAFHTYRKQLVAVVSEVESAYWDLALTRERLLIAEESLKVSRDIAEDARQRVSVGKLSELDLSEAGLQVDIRSAEREQAALAASEMSARLRLLLGGGRLGTNPALAAADALGWDDAAAELIRAEARARRDEALLFQPDVAIRRAELEKERIQLAYQRDQRLPDLTASARLGYQGVGETPTASLEKLASQEYPTWSLSLKFRLSLLGGLRSANAVEEARLRVEVAGSRLAAAERETSISVDALYQRVLSYLDQAASARAVTGFRSQLLDVEQKRFDEGKSDVRALYEVEQNLSEARSQELESCARLRKAASDLAAASGTTLRVHGLEQLEAGQIVMEKALVSAEGR
jgi:outer membrane protein TolC